MNDGPVYLRPRHLYLTDKVGRWCQLRYPGHPHGCPNYGRSYECPPHAAPLESLVDLSTVSLIGVRFDLAAHAQEMAKLHPGWTDRQCRNLLYWQPKVKAQLRRLCEMARAQAGLDYATLCPEGHGVNVVRTVLANGWSWYEVKPRNIVTKIALVGKKR